MISYKHKLTMSDIMIYVKNLLELSSFKSIELVTKDTGLSRRVSWPNIAQTVSIEEWLVGGDVIFMTGVGLDITEEFLTSIVRQAVNCNAACLIVLLSDEHIKQIPESTAQFAKQNDFPIFIAPWETKIANLIMNICMLLSDDTKNETIINEFAENILLGNIDMNSDETKLKLKKYNMNTCNQVAVVHFYNFNDLRFENEQKFRFCRINLYTKIHQELRKVLGNVLYISRNDEIIFIFKGNGKNSTRTKSAMENIADIAKSVFENIEVSIAVGGFNGHVNNLPISYTQAQNVLKIINAGNVAFFDSFGIFSLLGDVKPSKIADYIDENIGQLLKYDKKYNQELTRTLWVFLNNNSNMVQSAKALFIHRNTLVKRIEKTEEILGISLKDAEMMNTCYNCLKMLEFVKPHYDCTDDT